MRHLYVIAIGGMLLGAPLAQQQCDPADDDDAVGSGPEWVETIPGVGLSQGQTSSELNLDDYLNGGGYPNDQLTIVVDGGSSTSVMASVDADSHVLTLTAAADFQGPLDLSVTVTDPDGLFDVAPVSTYVHVNRSCETLFTYDSRLYGPATSVAVAGVWNDWSTTADMMVNDGAGLFSTPIVLESANYQYKFVKDGVEWIQDPSNPLTAWDPEAVHENSEVHVENCAQPLLTISSIEANARSIDASFYYQDGSGGQGPDLSSIWVTYADGRPVDSSLVSFDALNRLIVVTLPNLSPGKYSLKVSASDALGTGAETIFVPVWAEETPWDWRNATLYFAFTDRFEDGNGSNDSPVIDVPFQSNYQGGDFAGIQQKIEAGYFNNLGVNAIWISPQIDNTSNAEYGVDGRLYSGYHGYWPIQPQSPEPRFGTEMELRSLIDAAHDRGIRVLFDLVANHVHDDHPYYNQANIRDGWFNGTGAWDELCQNNDNWNQNPIGCWFADYLPDINYRNVDALHTMVDDALEIAKTYDVDGFRVDAVKHMENCYLYHLSTGVKDQIEHSSADAAQQFYLVGETFVGTWDWGCDGSTSCAQALQAYYINDRMLDGQFDFPLYWHVLMAFGRYEIGLNDLVYMLGESENYYGSEAIMSSFLGNHDVCRFASHADGQFEDLWCNGGKEQGWSDPPGAPSLAAHQKLRLAFTFLASIKGVPLVYYGDDIGMPGAGDPDNRRMMRFDSELSSNEMATLDYVNTLFTLRATHPSLRSADRSTLLGDDADVLVLGKSAGTEKAVVAINRAPWERTVTVDIASMGLTGTLTDGLNGGTVTPSGSNLTITIPSLTAAIYLQ